MNQYQQKLQEKRDYPHKTPKDKKITLKKTRIDSMKRVKKNAQLGMF